MALTNAWIPDPKDPLGERKSKSELTRYNRELSPGFRWSPAPASSYIDDAGWFNDNESDFDSTELL